ncbi:type II toxin-antitoxin system PemK/MazF family toxin [Mesorhizobium sp.]|uniref:type II toxin-antitoxin system PemK/MazF family toxin n=1 Tax=Mesorhizobium sp. TaxID=1871066 RepID=UPI0034556F08
MAGRPGWNSSIKTIKGIPRVRECFWFNLPGSHAPEIPDWHPCVVIRGARGADEKQHTVAIVPLTSREPSVERADIVRLSKNPNPIDDRPVWALCEFISTVALFRLERHEKRTGCHAADFFARPGENFGWDG